MLCADWLISRGIECLSEMLRLGKYSPSLEFSACEIRVSESQARYNFRSLEFSNFDNLDLGVS